MSNLTELLHEVTFGSRTAEDEAKSLGAYFVETAQWTRIRAGDKDIVYGPKGAGKSAIYAVMMQRQAELRRDGIVVKSGERSRGEPVFAELAAEPPQTEEEWRVLWRAYFICVIAEVLEEYAVETEAAKRVFVGLEREGLREGKGPSAWLRSARRFAKRIRTAKSVEGGANVDPATGAVGVSAKVELPESRSDAVDAAAAVSSLLEAADAALGEADLDVWIALDRLDAAFSDPSIESPAIRALMRVYLDFTTFEQVTPKIFLRTDIWKEISEQKGFREGSHVIRTETISWNRDTLLNLAVRRIVQNESLCRRFGIDGDEVLGDVTKQEQLFEELFEPLGGSNQAVLDWALEAISDGHGRSAPRELIHLLTVLRDKQIERLQVGREDPEGKVIFEADVRAAAMIEVSTVHLEQTLYSEIPKVRRYVEAMRGGSTIYMEEELGALWGDSIESPDAVIATLVDAGVLRRVPGRKAGFEVAMLYRPALELSSCARSDNGESDGPQ